MKKHVETGYRILTSSKQLIDITEYIHCHHERLDGKGYPYGKTESDIPLIARIISVADSFDAMVGKRPYRDPMTYEEACDELLEHTHTQFDYNVVDVFINKVIPKLKVD